MDSLEDCYPTPEVSVMSPEVSGMFEEEDSSAEKEDSQPESSDSLVKDLGNLSLDPGTKADTPQPEDWEKSLDSDDDVPRRPRRSLRERGRGDDLTRSEKALWEIRGRYPYRRRKARTVEYRDRMSKMKLFVDFLRFMPFRGMSGMSYFGMKNEALDCTCGCDHSGPLENAKIGSDFTPSI